MIQYEQTVERWGKFELMLQVREDERLFADSGIRAVFRKDARQFEAEGFYDGGGRLLVRFMPDEEGEWTFRVFGPSAPAGGYAGGFRCDPAGEANRGPVRVACATHFEYADGTPYTPFGTAAAAWHAQDGPRRSRTLRTLERAPFNKVRMNVIPRVEHVPSGEPAGPFAAKHGGGPDFDRFEPAYFGRLEKAVESLSQLGIEAELVLFPARWKENSGGRPTPEQEERYIRYTVSRMAACRNVWWSMAEMDGGTPEEAWRSRFRTLRECDYGHHLSTVHGSPSAYDWGVPWLTHISLRHEDVKLASDFTLYYEKPVVFDDCGREGIGPAREEGLTAEEMTYRIWEALARGGCAAHGESLRREDGSSWSIHGGELLGESAERIAFLRGLLEDAPSGLTYSRARHDASTLERPGEYYLQYFGPHRFSSRAFALPDGEYAVDLIDTWRMSIEQLEGTYEHRFQIKLPGETFRALRLRKVGGGKAQAAAASEAVWEDTD